MNISVPVPRRARSVSTSVVMSIHKMPWFPGLGIDLGSSGVQSNDAGDPDSGSNDLQNKPELICASSDAAGVTIDGTLNSTSSDAFVLEFFAGSTCDASGHGEGEQPLGTTGATTDGSGDVISIAPEDGSILERFPTSTYSFSGGLAFVDGKMGRPVGTIRDSL